MKFTLPLAAAACIAVAVFAVPPSVNRPGPSLHEPRVPASLSPHAPEPPTTLVVAGDRAPDFGWQAESARWLKLRDLRAQGHVLLVFDPDENRLAALERERPQLLDLGVVPAAVLGRRSGSAWSLARRLQLHLTVIPDPTRAIAGQFNVLDPITQRALPSWFVVDRAGRVRALGRSGLPERGYVQLVSVALAIPAPGVALPSAKH